jgi:hypothetical protein
MANALFPGLIFEHYPRRGADEPYFPEITPRPNYSK